MTTDGNTTATLRRLGESGLTVSFPEEDVRGRRVLDREGEELGTVDDLLVDDRDHKVRFLQVASGGILGLGEQKVMIPVDAIAQIVEDAVHVDQTREHVAGAPRYDPSVTRDTYWEEVYGYYGYGPYWSAGYVYPPFPSYPY
jgi:sporulation protein YlmC with PRC-barrel domain